MADLVFYGLLLAVMFVVLGFQVRYYLRRMLSQNWPTASATVKQGFVGVISRGAGASFFGYVFTVNDVQYSGRFVLPDNWDHAEKFQRELDGVPLLVKFRPSNPKVSLLANFYDPVFRGLVRGHTDGAGSYNQDLRLHCNLPRKGERFGAGTLVEQSYTNLEREQYINSWFVVPGNRKHEG